MAIDKMNRREFIKSMAGVLACIALPSNLDFFNDNNLSNKEGCQIITFNNKSIMINKNEHVIYNYIKNNYKNQPNKFIDELLNKFGTNNVNSFFDLFC